MDKSDYEDLMDQLDNEPHMATHPQGSALNGYLMPEDVDDWHEFDDIEVELQKPKPRKKRT